LEAILFSAREPLPGRRLAELAGLPDATAVRTLIRRLNAEYDSCGAAFRVFEVAGGYQLLTRPELARYIRMLLGEIAEPGLALSPAALETLTIVAYRQPVVRAEIEAIRGAYCGEVLRQLEEEDLIRVVGRAEELGRPFLYGTTKRFLEVFGLRDLQDLPKLPPIPGQAKTTSEVDGPVKEAPASASGENSAEDLAEENDV